MEQAPRKRRFIGIDGLTHVEKPPTGYTTMGFTFGWCGAAWNHGYNKQTSGALTCLWCATETIPKSDWHK